MIAQMKKPNQAEAARLSRKTGMESTIISVTLLQNIAGVHDNRGIIPGLNCRQLTVPLVIHLLTDQLRSEGLGNQAVGIGLGLSFDQFGFCIDLRSLFFLIGLGDGNLLRIIK